MGGGRINRTAIITGSTKGIGGHFQQAGAARELGCSPVGWLQEFFKILIETTQCSASNYMQ